MADQQTGLLSGATDDDCKHTVATLYTEARNMHGERSAYEFAAVKPEKISTTET